MTDKAMDEPKELRRIGRRKTDEVASNTRIIALLTTLRALSVVLVSVMCILSAVLGYVLASVNKTNDATKQVASIVCTIIQNAPITIPVECARYIPTTTTTQAK